MHILPEQKVVSEVTTRVHDRVPEVETQRVEVAVVHRFEVYADSKVRDFLPILVEREVVEQLRGRSRRQAG